MKAFEALQAAHSVIEAGWTTGANARDSVGNVVPLFSGNERARINPLAVSFNLYGGICKACADHPQAEPALMWETLARLARARSGVPGGINHVHPILAFNETPGRTKQEVLDLLAEAIAVLNPPPAPIQLGSPAPVLAI